MNTTILASFNRLLAAAALMFAFISSAHATLLTDLQALNTQASSLKTALSAIHFTSTAACQPVAQANQQARDLVNSLTAVNASLAAPLHIDADTLTALDQLATTTLGISTEALRISTDLQTFSSATQYLTVDNGLNAMLQLSDDIGTMADRIGTMSDKILIMSDNIGLMADRILLTQQLQSNNLALTVQNTLQTQSNALALVKLVEDASYNWNIANLITNGNLLASKMSAVVLNPFTMASQLASIENDVKTFRDQINSFNQTVVTDSASNTMTVNAATLNNWVSMSAMLAGLTTAVNGYTIAIDGLKATTSNPTLSDSMKSMLLLSSDIGVMSNRILEMADQILVMADNIGMQADLIVSTQGAMNVNIAAVQSSILASQTWTINLIKLRGL